MSLTDSIRSLYFEGFSIYEIAKKLDLTESQVVRILERLGFIR